MAAWPVVLRMHVDDSVCAKKTRKAVDKLRGTYTSYMSILSIFSKMICTYTDLIDMWVLHV
jgi:hypothetical protein